MIVREDGEYDSASDYDEETLALIASREEESSEQDTEVMGAESADQFPSLVAQRVLSVQLSQAEHNQRHNLFQTRGVAKNVLYGSSLMVGVATIWRALTWWRSSLSLHGGTHIHITFNGLTAPVDSR